MIGGHYMGRAIGLIKAVGDDGCQSMRDGNADTIAFKWLTEKTDVARQLTAQNITGRS